jgi:dTDP-4-amino-4,6-dideoxygalactose transaminase
LGWPQPLSELQSFCREKGITLIEDCALSFMSDLNGKPLGSFGDYSVFCLYKSVPVPNGGVLANNNMPRCDLSGISLQSCSSLSVAGRSTELVLNWVRSRNDRCGRALLAAKRVVGRALNSGGVKRMPVGDTGFDLSSVNAGMSRISHTLLARFRYDWIKEARRRNFDILEERLQGIVWLLERKLSKGVCPLFFPLLVKDKESAALSLAERGIKTVQFWNGGDPEARRPHSDAEFLRRHVLEVPIHQDVTPDGAHYIADQITSLGLGLVA